MTEVTGIHRLINKNSAETILAKKRIQIMKANKQEPKKTDKKGSPAKKTEQKKANETPQKIKKPTVVPGSKVDPLKPQRNTSARKRRYDFWVNYIKIFGVSGSLQIIGYIASIMIDNAEVFKNTPVAPIAAFGIFFIISILFSICYALKVNRDKKYKLLHIFCMPTNYTWLIGVVWVYAITKITVAIGAGLPANFG